MVRWDAPALVRRFYFALLRTKLRSGNSDVPLQDLSFKARSNQIIRRTRPAQPGIPSVTLQRPIFSPRCPLITRAHADGRFAVAIRTQMSTLKHSIRQQQAQLHNLENTILRGPRPLPPGVFNSPPMSPNEFDDPSSSSSRSHSHTPSSSTFPSSPLLKLQRRSSHEVLSGLAGPESNLPLPRPNANGRRGSLGEDGAIREGIPALSPSKRVSSPTRTLSRTSASPPAPTTLTTRPPQAYPYPPSVRSNLSTLATTSIEHTPTGHARALAEEASDSGLGSSTSSLQPAVSPNRRSSFAPGNTTKVLADLQAGVLHAKNALENTKGQLRLSQRQVSQLTRQAEDLKEVRERLRLENEGLNNVVARKERLLQEVRAFLYRQRATCAYTS